MGASKPRGPSPSRRSEPTPEVPDCAACGERWQEWLDFYAVCECCLAGKILQPASIPCEHSRQRSNSVGGVGTVTLCYCCNAMMPYVKLPSYSPAVDILAAWLAKTYPPREADSPLSDRVARALGRALPARDAWIAERIRPDDFESWSTGEFVMACMCLDDDWCAQNPRG